MTEEQRLRMVLAWLEDQIGMTSSETPRHTMYLIIRAYLKPIHERFVKEDNELEAMEKANERHAE
jgi:hypothetical protein